MHHPFLPAVIIAGTTTPQASYTAPKAWRARVGYCKKRIIPRIYITRRQIIRAIKIQYEDRKRNRWQGSTQPPTMMRITITKICIYQLVLIAYKRFFVVLR